MVAVESSEDGHSAHTQTPACDLTLPTLRALTDNLSLYELPVEFSTPPWSEWKVSDAFMREMTGLTIAHLDSMYKRSRGELASYRLSLRQAEGNAPVMSPHNMLCIAIHWLRKGHSWREMEHSFGRSHQWLHDMVKCTVSIIETSLFDELIRPIDSTSPPSTMSTIFDAFIAVDSTFIPLPRSPFKPRYFHPKSPTKSAWKVQIACDFSHRIVDVSKVERGAEADTTILLSLWCSGAGHRGPSHHR